LSQPDYKTLTTVEAVCASCPERVGALLDALDLSRPELKTIKQAVDAGDRVAACTALVAYYRSADTTAWLRNPQPEVDDDTLKAADLALKDTVTFYDQTDRVPRKPNGGLDWDYKGPTNDLEWTLALNRHFHIGWLFQAYLKTGRNQFVDTLDAHLRDWVVASHPYPANRSQNPMWRGLEVALRLKVWAAVFFGLQNDDRFQPGTRLLMLACLPEHAHYLRNFHAGGNWVTMELSALALIGAAWPEFNQSREWLEYAKKTLTAEIRGQVYPDGAQKELTSTYHWVAMDNFSQFADVCRDAREPLPEAFTRTLESMHNYLAYSLCPDGTGPLNNDSDHIHQDVGLLDAAERYHRPDWTYIASSGARGQKPVGQPSKMFEWAGQLVSRSGWEHEDHWSFFDVGPWGIGHQHNDKLHISVHAYGRDLLVDSGRFSYSGEVAARFRDYAIGSRGHNVILIDGHGQGPGELAAEKPLDPADWAIEPLFDYARGSFSKFDGIDGSATHTRALLYVRGRCWIVIDRITTDRPRRIDALWHFHPDCTVLFDQKTILTNDPDQGNLRIVSSSDAWETEIIRGQDKPRPQGWYSDRYNSVAKSSTAVCHASIDSTSTFAWLLAPGWCQVPHSRLSMADKQDCVDVLVDLDGRQICASVPIASGSKPTVRL
jgi:hypothetical protein